MKKCLLITLVLLLVSCSSPSEFAIQTAIAKTENAKAHAIVPSSGNVFEDAVTKTQTAAGLTGNSLINCIINSPAKNEWKTVVCDTFENTFLDYLSQIHNLHH